MALEAPQGLTAESMVVATSAPKLSWWPRRYLTTNRGENYQENYLAGSTSTTSASVYATSTSSPGFSFLR